MMTTPVGKLCSACHTIPFLKGDEVDMRYKSSDHHHTQEEMRLAADQGCAYCAVIWERWLDELSKRLSTLELAESQGRETELTIAIANGNPLAFSVCQAIIDGHDFCALAFAWQSVLGHASYLPRKSLPVRRVRGRVLPSDVYEVFMTVIST